MVALNALSAVPGDQMPSSDLCSTRHECGAQTHMQAECSRKIKNQKFRHPQNLYYFPTQPERTGLLVVSLGKQAGTLTRTGSEQAGCPATLRWGPAPEELTARSSKEILTGPLALVLQDPGCSVLTV